MDIIEVTLVDELKECLAIRKDVFILEQAVPEELEVDDHDRSPLSCKHLLIRLDRKGVATGRLCPYDEETAKLQRIAVRKEHRGKGMGAIIVQALEENAQREGYHRTLLDAQLHAQAFYEKLGYEKVSSESFLDAGIWHVRMVKVLPSQEI
ncbi:GNAT family N-acetyltransferase [Heliobacterium chlorum]|uniref:GNAT family N-acetyltransferase n=1 Tax=Heliobacterium chlorum TaxID=2698 RepID=UPI00311AB675